MTANIDLSIKRKLLVRELDGVRDIAAQSSIYGSKSFVKDLDKVNELWGHSGCVNALSWSQSGNLLASGSDDFHVNIHQRSSATSTFSLTHSISTGHTRNIFSVKFMPHSSDRTLVSAAGDSEVRIYDVEYNGTNTDLSNSNFATSTQHASRLSYGDTNTRVYRSHNERVKRIVTENSPYLFLTCSEDGDVRQFDTRAPTDPPPRSRFQRMRQDIGGRKALLSYRKVPMELNTLSVATSQPHYLAVGGTYLHCFLHDRRMLRQKDGAPECVRRFAPKRNESWSSTIARSGYITACKISDACPNELVVSWSSGGIGGFDIHRSPDAEEQAVLEEQQRAMLKTRARRVSNGIGKKPSGEERDGTPSSASSERKRKRGHQRSPGSQSPHRSRNKLSEAATQAEKEEKQAFCIASNFVAIRKDLYGRRTPNTAEFPNLDISASVTETLDKVQRVLDMMEDYMMRQEDDLEERLDKRTEPSTSALSTQIPSLTNSLRKQRKKARKNLEAMGTLIASLTYPRSVPVPPHDMDPRIYPGLDLGFQHLKRDSDPEPWGYKFLHLIIAYINCGRRGVQRYLRVEEPSKLDAELQRMTTNLVDDVGTPLLDLESSEEIFESNFNAMRAFASIVRMSDPQNEDIGHVARRYWGWKVARSLLLQLGHGIDFAMVESSFGGLSKEEHEAEDKAEEEATRLIQEAEVPAETLQQFMRRLEAEEEGEDSNDDVASDGKNEDVEMEDVESTRERSLSPSRLSNIIVLDPDDMEEEIDPMELPSLEDQSDSDLIDDSSDDDEAAEESDAPGDDTDVEDNSEEEGEDGEDDDEDNEDDDDDDDDDEGDNDENGDDIFREFSTRNGMRGNKQDRIHKNAPLYEHEKLYRGHCNIQTVKDVNFYGLNDEYVISGSDCGNVFIWDKKTTELVQILEGDSQIVNVVQGHPTEPLLAVSGIDNTIKIFSPDKLLQKQAREGIGIMNNKKLTSCQRFDDREHILSENEVGRQSGMRDQIITRTMLSQLAARVRQQQANGEEVNIQIDDCVIM